MSPTAPHELMHTEHTTHVVLFIKYIATFTHPLSPALCLQVKLRLGFLVFQPLLDVHQWTSAVVHLVHYIGLGLTDTHNLSYKSLP